MEYVTGLLIAVAVAALAALTGLDRDRSFYPTVAIVVASYYALFAAMGASAAVIRIETAVGAGFAALALVGFRRSMWLVAAAIAGHGAFDIVHSWFIDNPGVPVWWPGFCATVDLLLGCWVGIRLLKRMGRAEPAREG